MFHPATQSPIWHPFTQHALEKEMKKIIKTEGAYLFDVKNQPIFDAISSWWVITHGHRHPGIMDAICKACDHWDQIIFADFVHEPAEKLANELIKLAPKGLHYVFYSDSGSTAVEVALKMAIGYFKHIGQPRSRIIVMEHSYHGDTIGAMSVGERCVFNSTYAPWLFEVDRIPFPVPGNEQNTLDALLALCKTGSIAALLVEPLVLGAGGFKFYSPIILSELRAITKTYNTLLIADEVMTGWGRTGTLFACEQAKLTPDILCTAKGLTGGALPLAATLCAEPIFKAHYASDRTKTFFHSSSFTANPIATSAALANIEIWKKEPVFQRIQSLEKMLQQQLEFFKTDERFLNVRQLGTIGALDVDVKSTGYLSDIGPKLRNFFGEQNLLMRPLGNVIYLMPPYCTTQVDLTRTFQLIDQAVDSIFP